MDLEKRLIDANEEIRKIQSVLDEHQNEKDTTAHQAFEAFITCLENAPTVDAVEVVRCKDCKRYSQSGLCNLYLNISPEMKPNDFCSYGERKDNE